VPGRRRGRTGSGTGIVAGPGAAAARAYACPGAPTSPRCRRPLQASPTRDECGREEPSEKPPRFLECGSRGWLPAAEACDRVASRRCVVLAHGPCEFEQRFDRGTVEPTDAAVVQDDGSASLGKEQVPRVRIGVEEPVAIEGTEVEFVQGAARGISLLLPGLQDEPVERPALPPGGGQDPRCGGGWDEVDLSPNLVPKPCPQLVPSHTAAESRIRPNIEKTLNFRGI
jgi:hypothetical protein